MAETRAVRRQRKALEAEVRSLSARLRGWRESNLFWGLPWCQGDEYCARGTACIGCGVVAWHNDETEGIKRQIAEAKGRLKAFTSPEPVLSGELFALVGDRWVLA